jgi:alkylation response protein AidB-like acyl-CoA dehydrogenase
MLMPNTAERLLADIQQLAPKIATRAAEIEAEGQFPPDLVESLRSIGAFRMFAPQSHGGWSSICQWPSRSSQLSAK